MSKAVVILGAALVSVLLSSTVLMLLWDAVIPAIFGLPEITWLQSLGLFLLARIVVDPVKVELKG